ncbi:uncharacterized protein LOC111030205 [Myzus persicae]|uniref:uncharacterized protein LOC111030205 n=1 Tax=Myzus persicae TaxID=13164 RepID=UPI000B93302B|nr:uncharacterized protein LOC111030205 [Myzus persicae]
MSTTRFNTMYYLNFFEKLCFILITICQTFHGQLLKNDLENHLFCGLSKKQIHEAMSYTNNKYKTKGIAKNVECLEERNITNDHCLTEQYELIECLHKEYFLANEQGNEVIENNLANKDKKLQDMIKKRILQNIIDENEALDIMAKDYEETIVQHLQSIDDLTKKTICADDINKALTNTKVELTTVLRQQILKNNSDKISRLGIYYN